MDTPNAYLQYTLNGLAATESPLVQIDGERVTLSFGFDAHHDWIDLDVLLADLSNPHDKALLESETYGGRLARPEYFLGAIREFRLYNDMVADTTTWDAMTAHAHAIDERLTRPLSSYGFFADATFDVLYALAPYYEDDDFIVEVVDRSQAEADPHSACADWVRPDVEMLMRNVAEPADSIELTYPGHGNTLTFTARHGVTATVLDVTVARSAAVADLFDIHNDAAADTNFAVPVMATLNALSDDALEAILGTADTAVTFPVFTPDGRATGGLMVASECDAWTLLHVHEQQLDQP